MKLSFVQEKRKMARWWISPTIIIVLAVTVFPMFWSLYTSLHNVSFSMGQLSFHWNAGKNYIDVLTSSRFWTGVMRVLYYGGVGTAMQVVLGIVIALIIYNFIRGWKQIMVLSLFITPMATAPVVAGFIWRFFFDPAYSVTNAFLAILGVKGPSWLSSKLALTSVMIADIWQWTPLPLLLIFAGRGSLPEDIYEAAKIDGASNWSIFWNITFPLLKNIIVIAFMLRCMDTYKFFDKVYVMTRGGPGDATELPALYTYLEAFQNFNLGRASALTWVLAAGAIVMFQLFWSFFRKH